MIFQNYVSSVQISYFVQIHHTSAFASGFGFLIHLCFTSRMRMRMEFLGKELWLSNTIYQTTQIMKKEKQKLQKLQKVAFYRCLTILIRTYKHYNFYMQ